jgi:transposase
MTKRRPTIDPAQVRALYEGGMTLDRIAKHLSTSHGTARRRAVEAGVVFRRTGPSFPTVSHDVAVILAKSRTLKEAAAALGVSVTTAWKMRRRFVLERVQA